MYLCIDSVLVKASLDHPALSCVQWFEFITLWVCTHVCFRRWKQTGLHSDLQEAAGGGFHTHPHKCEDMKIHKTKNALKLGEQSWADNSLSFTPSGYTVSISTEHQQSTHNHKILLLQIQDYETWERIRHSMGLRICSTKSKHTESHTCREQLWSVEIEICLHVCFCVCL